MRLTTLASAWLIAAGALFPVPLRAAGVVPVQWGPSGDFDHRLTVPAGRFAEVCGPLPAAATVDWSFSADTALDFNIHFHEGEKVEYPEKRAGVPQGDGRLQVQTAQDYCWMWRNPSSGDAQLRLTLKRR